MKILGVDPGVARMGWAVIEERSGTITPLAYGCLTTEKEELRKYKGYFNFIIDTVSAPHNYNTYLSLLTTNGTHICVGAPPSPSEVAAFSLIGNRRSIAGSLIGGLPETQEMLDYCSEKEIVSDVELIKIQDINTAYERMLKGDVRYRFVIDMASLH